MESLYSTALLLIHVRIVFTVSGSFSDQVSIWCFQLLATVQF